MSFSLVVDSEEGIGVDRGGGGGGGGVREGVGRVGGGSVLLSTEVLPDVSSSSSSVT